MVWITILVSLALILFGRHLYWLFVGAVGFIAGISLSAQVLKGQPDWVLLVIGILAGLAGYLLAVFLQRLAISIAGFVAGAFILVNLLPLLGIQPGDLSWLVILLGGIFGAVLLISAFDWAVILLSSLAGSVMIIRTLDLQAATAAMVLVGLMLVGILSQSRSGKTTRPRSQH